MGCGWSSCLSEPRIGLSPAAWPENSGAGTAGSRGRAVAARVAARVTARVGGDSGARWISPSVIRTWKLPRRVAPRRSCWTRPTSSCPTCSRSRLTGYGMQDESEVSALVDDRPLSVAYASQHRRHGVRASGGACDTGGLVSNSGALPRSQRSSCSATSIGACLRRAHSQTVATRQPAWNRSRRLRRSRSVFSSNLARQNPRRVDGVVAYGQPACRCQKHPCTRHTAPNRRNTRSGVPGSLRSCRRNRSPRAWMARRRASSGRVFLLPIPAIMRERVARSTMSAIVVPAPPAEGHRRQEATREILDAMRLHGILQRRAGPDWFARPRCGDAPAEDGTGGSPGGIGAVSPFECDP